MQTYANFVGLLNAYSCEKKRIYLKKCIIVWKVNGYTTIGQKKNNNVCTLELLTVSSYYDNINNR